MGIDLRLKGIKFLLSFCLVLRDDILHQQPDLRRHIPDGFTQMLYLVGAARIDRHIQIAFLQDSHRLFQFLDWIGNS